MCKVFNNLRLSCLGNFLPCRGGRKGQEQFTEEGAYSSRKNNPNFLKTSSTRPGLSEIYALNRVVSDIGRGSSPISCYTFHSLLKGYYLSNLTRIALPSQLTRE